MISSYPLLKAAAHGGRVVKKDIQAALTVKKSTPSLSTGSKETSPMPQEGKSTVQLAPVPIASGEAPPDQVIPINRLRGAIGRRMLDSKQTIPHFYVTHSYDMEPVMKLRKQINGLLPDNEKISVNDFIVKAAALTLRQFPALNASISGKEFIQHGQVNIGIAVAVEGGLMTIVVKNSNRKSIRQISGEVKEMANRARSGKVKTEDIEGSTFSISNLGMFDVEDFIAIINPPEAAILAVGTAQKVPVVVENELTIGYRMKATISADHRITDGAEAAQFMQLLARYLEKPVHLLL